ncbi:hypothetical protein G3T14_17635 [Methylobacterium sp. BTF04]|uniref:hypothetical protein n=1 Tax=Methylobacterium sp. BTF04 TaxID=2708300 RepID=UPI0013CF4B02|nr:hypothetical protein [Methylobacterium sp. BTF04]NEU13936.1 hypothetical protein [Methylobacterium sp. BTF04]
MMQAEMKEKARPLPGERLDGLEDLLANPDTPDGTRMTDAFMDGLRGGWMERSTLLGLNAFVEAPNILRRKTTFDGEHWHGLTPDEIRHRQAFLLATVRADLQDPMLNDPARPVTLVAQSFPSPRILLTADDIVSIPTDDGTPGWGFEWTDPS